MYNNILVIADQDVDQHAAMQKAREVATSDDAKISVIGFVAASDAAAADAKREALEKAVADEFAGMANVSCEVVQTDDIADYCKTYTKENGIELVVKTGNRTESLFYTPLDFQLVRELKCAVMISTLQKWRANKSVMVTLDIETDNDAQIALNKKVAHWAKSWAADHGCDLHVANCIAIPEALTELDIVSKDEVRMKKSAALKEKLETFLTDEGIECAGIEQEAGQPDRVLPSIANRLKADVVVLGSVGRKGIKGVLLGNTAEKTMHKLRTDLIVVHPD